QPDVHFTGADINRVALDDARTQASARGLGNVTFVECDLMTLDGLDVPAGGFDVIHSSGVLHHLSDPAAGLARLREVLAPHGLLNLMIYGKHGREPLMRLAAATSLLFPGEAPSLAERIPVAREVARLGRDTVLAGTRFGDTAEVDDVEFVDRLLNVNETSYDVGAVLALLATAGLGFVRWIEPADWDVARLVPAGPVRDRLAACDPVTQWRFLELIRQPAGLELVAGQAGNGLRPALTANEAAQARFRLNPEAVVLTGVRHTPAGVRTESVEVRLRTREPLRIGHQAAAAALLVLRDDPRICTGSELLAMQGDLGTAPDLALGVLLELVKEEILARAD
ncbi:class I SAM-dependent methyltransferase, partial [bacterium]|nr:class I SAM-dependent methyltransferase [bacterium]